MRDLSLAALFLCITLRFAALSSVLNASEIDFFVGDLRAVFTTAYTDLRIFIVTFVRFLSCRNFFEACFVIGIMNEVYHIL